MAGKLRVRAFEVSRWVFSRTAVVAAWAVPALGLFMMTASALRFPAWWSHVFAVAACIALGAVGLMVLSGIIAVLLKPRTALHEVPHE